MPHYNHNEIHLKCGDFTMKCPVCGKPVEMTFEDEYNAIRRGGVETGYNGTCPKGHEVHLDVFVDECTKFDLLDITRKPKAKAS